MSELVIFIGRFLMGAYFVQAGLRNALRFELHVGLLAQKQVPLPRAALVVALAVQLVAGLMVALGLEPRIGALALIAFTLVANATHHNFLTRKGKERESEINVVLGNLALIGGLLLVVALK